MRIGRLMAQSRRPFFSLEFFPPSDQAQLGDFYRTADELGKLSPLFASVTYGAGGHKQRNTLEVTGELARRGFTVMAHLTCVGAAPESIKSFIGELLERKVDNILALRGDPPRGAEWKWEDGRFRHAVDLVAFARENYPDLGIGVAVYPAPHPESPTFADDRRHTAEKLAAGADFGISQLFFDSREYIELVENLKKAGISLPIIPGILPIQSLDSIKRVISLCGANIPGKFFLELEQANASGGAGAVREAGLRFAIRQIRELLDYGAPGIHLYTLNKSALCKRIVQEAGLA